MPFPANLSSSAGGSGRLRKRQGQGAAPRSASAWNASSWTKAIVVLCSAYLGVSVYSFFALHSILEDKPPVTHNSNTKLSAGFVEPATASLRNPTKHAREPEPADKDNDQRPPIEPKATTTKSHSQSYPEKHSHLSPPKTSRQTTTPFRFDEEQAEAALKKHGAKSIHKTLTAYVEPPLHDTVPGTGSRGDMNAKRDDGVKPTFVVPLPLRKHTPDDLLRYEYNRVQTCHDMPGKFPIDKGLELDENGDVIVWNVGDTATPDDFPEQEAPYCPVEADPFLPWIHDVFPSQDGTLIRFIAQNKRRCRTGTNFGKDVERLVPQVALMQSVSVQRIDESQAQSLAPALWHPDRNNAAVTQESPRYRLAPYEESSDDGMFTRFICRFHTIDLTGDSPQTVPLGETLSQFPFNYELVSYRKGQHAMLSPKGKDTRLFWASNIRFDCPVPTDDALRQHLAAGTTILSDGTPTVYVDLVPIRTSVRYDELHLTEDMIGPRETWALDGFNATERWGDQNVLPRVEASGRWANIPVCLPPRLPESEVQKAAVPVSSNKSTVVSTAKPHYLSACLWASAEFKTRGLKKGATTDTQDRLKEWLEFHFMVGFDHVYVYDNSGAHTNETSLEPIISQYPGKVTRIDWPSIVCNNNIPAHDNTGERSSQYAAENSCRTRYGPFTEWLASFDTDEFLVPAGNHTNLQDVLKDAHGKGTKILSFRSSRGRLRADAAEQVGSGMEQKPGTTFLEAYNCDSAGSPKPAWADRARKQIYQPDYVLYHYIHYSTVTEGYLRTYNETPGKWSHRYSEKAPIERTTDELNEAVMIHAKTIKKDMTSGYERKCRFDFEKKWLGCWVAYPWPNNTVGEEGAHTADGMEYNCFINKQVDDYWVPRLRKQLQLSSTVS